MAVCASGSGYVGRCRAAAERARTAHERARRATTAARVAPWGGAIYLHTGRHTSIPNPEELALGAQEWESVRLYATRLRGDSINVPVIRDRAAGRRSAPWLRQLGVL